MKSRRLGIIWDERFSNIDFGEEHPVKSNRGLKTFLLLKEIGLINEKVEIYTTKIATEEDLSLVHDFE